MPFSLILKRYGILGPELAKPHCRHTSGTTLSLGRSARQRSPSALDKMICPGQRSKRLGISNLSARMRLIATKIPNGKSFVKISLVFPLNPWLIGDLAKFFEKIFGVNLFDASASESCKWILGKEKLTLEASVCGPFGTNERI